MYRSGSAQAQEVTTGFTVHETDKLARKCHVIKTDLDAQAMRMTAITNLGILPGCSGFGNSFEFRERNDFERIFIRSSKVG
jgi:hypothetical protein